MAFTRVSAEDTLPPLVDGKAPTTVEETWAGFDPRKEPLDVEVLKEWEEDGVVVKVLRYRIGTFKGQKAMMAAVYGYPKGAKNLPGLVQLHGGGQSAQSSFVVKDAKTATPRYPSPGQGGSSQPNIRSPTKRKRCSGPATRRIRTTW